MDRASSLLSSSCRLNHVRGWCSHCTTRRMSCFWQPMAKGRSRSWTDPTAECGGVNPSNQEWSPEGGQFPVFTHCSAAPTAKLVPNVLLCIPLDYIGGAERGILMTGHPRISIHSAQAAQTAKPVPGKTRRRKNKPDQTPLKRQPQRTGLHVLLAGEGA